MIGHRLIKETCIRGHTSHYLLYDIVTVQSVVPSYLRQWMYEKFYINVCKFIRLCMFSSEAFSRKSQIATDRDSWSKLRELLNLTGHIGNKKGQFSILLLWYSRTNVFQTPGLCWLIRYNQICIIVHSTIRIEYLRSPLCKMFNASSAVVIGISERCSTNTSFFSLFLTFKFAPSFFNKSVMT